MDQTSAAVRIQAFARGLVARRRVARLHAAAIAIQRLWRGRSVRQAVKAILQEDIAGLLLQIYHRAATTIQAAWRGRSVRKNVFCYRVYIAWRGRCIRRGDSLKKLMLNQRELMEEEDRYKAELEAEKCSQLVLRKLHHLVSTKTTPGVFNSPRNPSVRPVEEGLKNLRFHSMSPSSNCASLADQIHALDWEAAQSQKLSVQRAIRLPETWRTRLRNLKSIVT